MRKVNKSLQKEINERTIYEAVWNGRVWNIEDRNCVKIAEADGITCICNKAGMYALINQISFSKVIITLFLWFLYVNLCSRLYDVTYCFEFCIIITTVMSM